MPLPAPAMTTTPNPRCGVAGASSAHLQALRLSVGTPEPGGYVWDKLTEGNRGLAWLIGNEPDLGGQDGFATVPTGTQEYARMYHYFYNLIKATDSTAQVAIGGISQVGSYAYANNVLTAYRTLYAQEQKFPDCHRSTPNSERRC